MLEQENIVVTELVLYTDTMMQNSPVYVYAKQNDVNSRYLHVTIKGTSGKINVTGNARLNAITPKGIRYVDGEINVDGTVTVCIAPDMLTTYGKLTCDMSILGDGTSLTTSPFYIIVSGSHEEDNDGDGGEVPQKILSNPVISISGSSIVLTSHDPESGFTSLYVNGNRLVNVLVDIFDLQNLDLVPGEYEIKAKSFPKNDSYTESGFSQSVTYTAKENATHAKYTAPELTIDSNRIAIAKADNNETIGSYAVCHFYVDGLFKKEVAFSSKIAELDLTTLNLSTGTYSITAKIHVISENGLYADSDFSNSVIYNAFIKYKAPVLTIDNETGIVTATTTEEVDSYATCVFYAGNSAIAQRPFESRAAQMNLSSLNLLPGDYTITATVFPKSFSDKGESERSNPVNYTVEIKKLPSPILTYMNEVVSVTNSSSMPSDAEYLYELYIGSEKITQDGDTVMSFPREVIWSLMSTNGLSSGELYNITAIAYPINNSVEKYSRSDASSPVTVYKAITPVVKINEDVLVVVSADNSALTMQLYCDGSYVTDIPFNDTDEMWYYDLQTLKGTMSPGNHQISAKTLLAEYDGNIWLESEFSTPVVYYIEDETISQYQAPVLTIENDIAIATAIAKEGLLGTSSGRCTFYITGSGGFKSTYASFFVSTAGALCSTLNLASLSLENGVYMITATINDEYNSLRESDNSNAEFYAVNDDSSTDKHITPTLTIDYDTATVTATTTENIGTYAICRFYVGGSNDVVIRNEPFSSRQSTLELSTLNLLPGIYSITATTYPISGDKDESDFAPPVTYTVE